MIKILQMLKIFTISYLIFWIKVQKMYLTLAQ